AGSDVSFLQSASKDIQNMSQRYFDLKAADSTRRPDKIFEIVRKWKHSIQLTEPRGAIVPVDDLLHRVTKTFLREFRKADAVQSSGAKVAPRGRSYAVKLVRQIVAAEVGKFLQQNAHGFVRRDKVLQGAMDEHKFDVVITNGA